MARGQPRRGRSTVPARASAHVLFVRFWSLGPGDPLGREQRSYLDPADVAYLHHLLRPRSSPWFPRMSLALASACAQNQEDREGQE